MRIGTVGTGAIVEEFIAAVGKVDQMECAAVYSRKEETAARLSEKYKIKQQYTDYEALLMNDNVDSIYIALPNSLHFEYAFKALKKGKHVICEKPFTSTVKEASTLITYAKEKKLFLFEAIKTLHLLNYQVIKENLKEIGEVRFVQCNFSRYSSRYRDFLEGKESNVFNPLFSGGALADINVYNLHFVTGLFGKAKEIKYIANKAANGIDTSGVAILEYDGFLCECVGAKDSTSPCFAIIQGTKGYLKVNSSTSQCLSLELCIGDDTKTFQKQVPGHGMVYELECFQNIYSEKEYEKCYRLLDHSLSVVELLVAARKDAGIVFAADATNTQCNLLL
jgi:predicted dehydrogenase